MKKIISQILSKIEQYIPKNKEILFHSFPDYSDNSYALFKYMMKNSIKKEKIIWLYNENNIEKKILDEFGERIKCYKKNSLLGIWKFLRSEKIFCTHGIFSFIKTKGKKINLWHGMPLKTVGLLVKDSNEKTTCDFTISTSEIFKKVMKKSFDLNEDNVFLTGQPRNDLLFEKSNFYEKNNIIKETYNKIIIYLPTYRKSIIGQTREDGIYEEDKIGIIKLNELDKLNKNLFTNNNMMIIKLHPMDFIQTIQLKKFSNIIILKTKDLEKINEQLYPLLGSTDLLITDYSSVWVDYEILGKPIYFAMDDYEVYKSNRGFTIENLQDILPGEIIESFDVLLKKLNKIPNKIENQTGDIFNKYKDNKSSERILKQLDILL